MWTRVAVVRRVAKLVAMRLLAQQTPRAAKAVGDAAFAKVEMAAESHKLLRSQGAFGGPFNSVYCSFRGCSNIFVY